MKIRAIHMLNQQLTKMNMEYNEARSNNRYNTLASSKDISR